MGSHPRDPAYQSIPPSPPPPQPSSSGSEPPSKTTVDPPPPPLKTDKNSSETIIDSINATANDNPGNLPATVPFDPTQFTHSATTSSTHSQSQGNQGQGQSRNAPGGGRGRNPPFHTHGFFVALERSGFPTETAKGLMGATSALLSDRIGRVRREGLTRKGMDNQAYLFRAALSELKSEISMHSRNESAALQTSTTALRREVDRLDVKMKEDVTTLKHEIQMEFDSRKNEARSEFKNEDLLIEEMLSKNFVLLNNLKTDVEENRWDTMRRTVVTLAAFVIAIIVSLELQPKKPAKSAEAPHPLPSHRVPMSASDLRQPEAEGLEKMDWVT